MSSHRLKHSAPSLITAAIAVLMVSIPIPASADPALPGDAPTAVQRLAELNREAEVLTERWHYARDQVNARRADLERARADVTAAAASGERAKTVEDQYRGQVDRLTNASFQGARLNRLTALLISDSPEEFLDQMSALDVLAVDNKQALDRLTGAVTQAQQAEQSADHAAARAGQAEHDAARLEGDLTRSRAEMDRQIQVVKQRLAALNSQERAAYTSGGSTSFSISRSAVC